MRAAIYTRVSTTMQVNEGVSLDAQLDRLRMFCDMNNWQVVGVYTDEGLSAKNTERPELHNMLNDIEAGKIDVVLVYKLDRLTRSVLDLYDLLQHFEKYHVGFRSASEVFDTTTAVGRLFITLIGALAQWERETIAERTRDAQLQMTKQGRWSGGIAAFGYDYVDGSLVINEMEADVVRGIFQRYVSGVGTVSILGWLNNPESSQPAPRNRRWTLTALKYVLRNPLYAGCVRYGYRKNTGKRQKEYMVEPGTHEAIIDEDTWERACAVRERRSMMPSRTGTGTYALSGLLRCGLCGSAMNGRTVYRSNKANSPQRRYYMCVERQHSRLCKMPMVLEEQIEWRVLEVLKEYRANNVPIEEQVDSRNEKLIRSIENEREKLQTYRQRFMTAYAKGDMTSSELREQLDLLSEQDRQLERKLQYAQKQSEKKLDMALFAEVVKSLEAGWSMIEAAEKKVTLRTIIDNIIVREDKTIEVNFLL